MKIIAVEEHFLTVKFLEYLRERKKFPKIETFKQGNETLEREWWSPINYSIINKGQKAQLLDIGEGRLSAMDAAGIDIQVLSLCFPGVQQFAASDGTRLSRIVNDELAEAVTRHSKRFAGFAAIAPQDPESAARELERSVKILGLKGVMITGHIKGEYLDNKRYWPIFEQAEKLNVPIYIHPYMPSPKMIKPYLDYPVLAGAMLGFAADTSLHVMRLILSGVFDKYPGLSIILGHLGEALPFWLWRLDSRWLEKHDDESGANSMSLQRKPSQYFKDNFYVTTSGMYWEPVLQFVRSILGIDKILFATDYPHELTSAVSFIKSVSLSDEDKQQICQLNAERLLKL